MNNAIPDIQRSSWERLAIFIVRSFCGTVGLEDVQGIEF